MKFETVLLETREHIATITLNRPERLNALNEQMFTDLRHALREVTDDQDVRVVVLTGAGRAFCASADVNAEKNGDTLIGPGAHANLQFIRNNPQQVTLLIHQMPKPTIAMVNGLAIGDGFDWVLACDIRIGCENARFMNAFQRMGLVPATGGAWLYTRAMGLNRALEMLYTADWLEAEEAYRIGVLNHLVSSAQLEAETMALAKRIAEKAPVSIRLVKEMVFRALQQSLPEHLPEAGQMEALALTTEDHKIALKAFLEKHPPHFTGR